MRADQAEHESIETVDSLTLNVPPFSVNCERWRIIDGTVLQIFRCRRFGGWGHLAELPRRCCADSSRGLAAERGRSDAPDRAMAAYLARRPGLGAGTGRRCVGGAIAATQPWAYGGYYDDYAYAPGYAYGPTYGYRSENADGYCAQRFRSYDPASGTYLGYDGERHSCP